MFLCNVNSADAASALLLLTNDNQYDDSDNGDNSTSFKIPTQQRSSTVFPIEEPQKTNDATPSKKAKM